MVPADGQIEFKVSGAGATQVLRGYFALDTAANDYGGLLPVTQKATFTADEQGIATVRATLRPDMGLGLSSLYVVEPAGGSNDRTVGTTAGAAVTEPIVAAFSVVKRLSLTVRQAAPTPRPSMPGLPSTGAGGGTGTDTRALFLAALLAIVASGIAAMARRQRRKERFGARDAER